MVCTVIKAIEAEKLEWFMDWMRFTLLWLQDGFESRNLFNDAPQWCNSPFAIPQIQSLILPSESGVNLHNNDFNSKISTFLTPNRTKNGSSTWIHSSTNSIRSKSRTQRSPLWSIIPNSRFNSILRQHRTVNYPYKLVRHFQGTSAWTSTVAVGYV